MKSRKIRSILALTITRCFIKSDRAGLIIEHSINYRLNGEHCRAVQSFRGHRGLRTVFSSENISIILQTFLHATGEGILKLKRRKTDGSFIFAPLLNFIFNYQRADDKSFVCKFSKDVKFKLYHIENSKTRGQTV